MTRRRAEAVRVWKRNTVTQKGNIDTKNKRGRPHYCFFFLLLAAHITLDGLPFRLYLFLLFIPLSPSLCSLES
jgi:hypothetical protein